MVCSFTGSMNYDDYLAASSAIIDQYMNVVAYRNDLLNEFSKNCEPFQVNQSHISEMRRFEIEYAKIKRFRITVIESDGKRQPTTTRNRETKKRTDRRETTRDVRRGMRCLVIVRINGRPMKFLLSSDSDNTLYLSHE